MAVEFPLVELVQAQAQISASAPLIINRDPGPGEVGAPRAGTFSFDLIDPQGAGFRFDPGFRVLVDGETVVFAGNISGPGWTGSVTVLPSNNVRVTLTPPSEYQSEYEVSVQVIARTLGFSAGSWNYSFTIEDYTAPVLIGAQARDSETVRLAFSEDVTVPEDATFAIEAQTTPAVDVAISSARSSGTFVDLTIDRPLSSGATYKVTVTGVEDLQFNPVAPGSSALFVGLCGAAVEGRSFDIWEMLPRHNRRADSSGDLRLIADVYQDLFDVMLCEIDDFRRIYDVERCSETYLDMLLVGLGNPFDTADLSLTKKRRLCASLVEIYQKKGTAEGIKDVVRFFLGLEIEILPLGHIGVPLGTARLDIDLVLGSSEPRVLYSFVVVVPRELTDDERSELEAIVLYMKPAREHLAAIREPDEPEPGPWELGVDELGVGTILS